jgi:NlpC/P60 family protein
MRKAKSKFDRNRANKLVFAVCLLGLCCVAASLAFAHAVPSQQEARASSRLLNAKDGRAIVKAARVHEQPLRGAQDCSHLVHEIYVLAGFEYPYASSFDLYAGSEKFERVKAPQPGDLIVWPGHAGIVLDPAKHSFYSLVRSGLDAEDYDGPYWRSRGRPRFFRYVVEGRGNVLVAKTPAASRAAETTSQHGGAAVREERSDVESSEAKRSAKVASERTAVIYGPTAPEVPAATMEVPASIVIAEGRQQPTRDEVAEGISELSNAAGNILRTDDPLQLRMPVVIFDQLSVERVEIKRDHGWAHLQIDSRASIAGQEIDLKKRIEKVRWELRRTESGWEAVTPLDRTYVPRDVAVRILAAQLAQLTQSDGAAGHADAILRQEAQLASLLNALLENK